MSHGEQWREREQGTAKGAFRWLALLNHPTSTSTSLPSIAHGVYVPFPPWLLTPVALHASTGGVFLIHLSARATTHLPPSPTISADSGHFPSRGPTAPRTTITSRARHSRLLIAMGPPPPTIR